MPIKVCHVTSVHNALDTRIFYKECVSLSKLYDVYLVAANAKNQVLKGVTIIGCPLPKGRLKRILFSGYMIKSLLDVDATVYHFHDPELIRVGLKLKKKGKKIVFDSHEDVPMQILCKEWIPGFLRKPISYLYSKYEKHTLRYYNALVTVTPIIYDRLKKINNNTYQVTNYPVYKDLPIVREKKRQICFAGGISEQYQHEQIINSLPQTNMRYALAGRAYTPYLNRLKGLDNWNLVDYKGEIPYEEVLDIMQHSIAGVAILFYSPNVGYKKGTLGVLKIFEFMMAGIPVISTDFDLWKEIIEGNECGICVNPYNTEEIVNAINYLDSNPEEAQKMGLNGKNAVKEYYNWHSQEQILFELYKKILA